MTKVAKQNASRAGTAEAHEADLAEQGHELSPEVEAQFEDLAALEALARHGAFLDEEAYGTGVAVGVVGTTER